MQRAPPRVAKFTSSYQQQTPIQIDVTASEMARFGQPQSCRDEQRKERHIRLGAQPPTRQHPAGLLQYGRDLSVTVDVRRLTGGIRPSRSLGGISVPGSINARCCMNGRIIFRRSLAGLTSPSVIPNNPVPSPRISGLSMCRLTPRTSRVASISL